MFWILKTISDIKASILHKQRLVQGNLAAAAVAATATATVTSNIATLLIASEIIII